MKPKKLKITNARENNLKNLSLELPHDELVVVTGLSGSGKSSLAFDTIYAEGQRRYIETFSPYTRQFFDKVKKPDADLIEHVRPAIAIQQRTRVTNSRSTVGSMTNVNDYLKALWSAVAEPLCPVCNIKLESWTPLDLTRHLERLTQLKSGSSFAICAPLTIEIKKGKNTLKSEIERLVLLGFSRFFNPATQTIEQLEEVARPPLTEDGRLLLVLQRIKTGSFEHDTVRDSIEQAFLLAQGSCTLIVLEKERTHRSYLQVLNNPSQRNIKRSYTTLWFNERPGCQFEKIKLERPKPALFSFNHPYGACPECKGFGKILSVNPELCVPNPMLSIKDKALQCWAGKGARGEYKDLLELCKKQKISTTLPWKDLPQEHRDLIFNHKSKEYWGVYAWFRWLERKAYKMHVRVFLSRYRSQFDCPDCGGTRLKKDALAYRIRGKTLPEIWKMPVGELLPWMRALEEESLREKRFPQQVFDVFRAVISRLAYLCDLGLPYLTLERQARTLSGGETQRVNLASALGSELITTHFVLDEPSVGLHPRDTTRLIKSIERLRNQGNSLLVVEHDLECIGAADHILELGPRAGTEGGEIVYNGPSTRWQGITIGKELKTSTLLQDNKPPAKGNRLKIKNARARNLKQLDVDIPLQSFVCLTGVSGSGKSTLVNEVIQKRYYDFTIGLENKSGIDIVEGFDQLEQLLLVDQSPLSKSPRANIATYTKVWDLVREMLVDSEDAKRLALGKNAFSFNVDGGRCPTCKGAGFLREDMQFLSDVFIPCETCLGKRFQDVVLQVRYKDKNVDELLKTSIQDCIKLFENKPFISEVATTLSLLGLGHLTLGHPLSELSGGEAQRLKLVPFISKSSKGRSLLIFDEPTTGLHQHDVERLVGVLRFLCEQGHSVLCVEHNLTLIAAADWIIDLGPEGGDHGGQLLRAGTPHSFVREKTKVFSHTAEHLQKFSESLAHPAAAKNTPIRLSRNTPKENALELRGAREHNLKNVDLSIPLNQIVALTGVSGSGKSTIAKDIVYAEGQRRYLDCLSPYARQFIKELKRPDIDELKNIKPTICVYQHTFQPSRLSTVATMAEIYNFLRLLYAKTGVQHCPDHPSEAISPLSAEEMSSQIKEIKTDSLRIIAPVIKLKKGLHKPIFERALTSEISEVRVDGHFAPPGRFLEGLEKTKSHSIDFVVAKFNPRRMDAELILDAVKQGLSIGGGTIIVHHDGEDLVFSMDRTCPICKQGFFKPDPEDLSFNSKRGACPKCQGSGRDARGALCIECGGSRINAIGRNLRILGHNIYEMCTRSAPDLHALISEIKFSPTDRKIAEPILRELFTKLQVVSSIGLDYLSLNRECSTLSSGELQRLRLATAMGSPLAGVLYIFDEPSAGLHPLDNIKVLDRLDDLKERGNSIIMIEHDVQSIRSADYVVDVGPGGGSQGGEIVFAGPMSAFLKNTSSITARMLHIDATPVPASRTAGSGSLSIRKASKNNIHNLSLDIPLHCISTVIGVSGAGKSSLVHGVVFDAIDAAKEKSKSWKIGSAEISSSEEITRALLIDQKPIGVNSRSTPASYLGIWDEIRKLFAHTLEAKARGWPLGFFSYNTGKGRCAECKGQGQIKLEMSFLPDAAMECETCLGRRYNEEANSITYLEHTISEVLDLTFEQARSLFSNHRRIHAPLHQACELGLGYLTLGQSSVTLSGGESQRIKLVSELGARRQGHSLYILDEPTTGLHRADVAKLMRVLSELVALGNTVLLIEHDLDVIHGSDHLIELGPGPGEAGGKVIFEGTLSKLSKAATPWGSILRSGIDLYPRKVHAADVIEAAHVD